MLEKRMSKTMLFMALVLITISAVAGVYKWVDENGKVQFGDRPPPEVESTDEVVIRNQGSTSEPTPDVNRKETRDRLLEQYQRERDEKKETEEKKRKEEQERVARCNYAKNSLTEYLEHGVLYERLPNQERRYLTDQERNTEIAQARAEVKKWCK